MRTPDAWRFRIAQLTVLLAVVAVPVSACSGRVARTGTPTESSTVPSADSSGANAPKTSPALACTADGLAPSLVFNGGAAGTIFYTVELANIGGATCSLAGSPVVFAIGADGATANPTTSPTSTASPVPVSLVGHQVARFSFSYLDDPQRGASTCPTVNELVIHISGLSDPIDLHAHVGPVCSSVFVGNLETGP
jgi:hypothetical protein